MKQDAQGMILIYPLGSEILKKAKRGLEKHPLKLLVNRLSTKNTSGDP
jgi:hypothetical protein